jgi:glutathione S-transferase
MSDSESAAPVCEEKARLLRGCAVAESNHQSVIQQVTWLIGRPEKPSYEDLTELAETARMAVEEARQALERHTAEHGC